MNRKIAVIGPGRLGQSIANLLCEAGHDLRAIVSRDLRQAVAAARFAGCRAAATTDLHKVVEADVVMIALPDDRIGEMATRLRQQVALRSGTVLVHFSGIHRASIMLGPERDDLKALSLHPLQSFPDAVIGVRALPGSPFAIEGENDVIPLGESLVRDIGGLPFRIDSEQKPLYHAAACMASNFMVTLMAAAREIMTACGFAEQDAFRLLTSLFKDTGKNLAALGPEHALTGPISRGDVRTVEKHLKALSGMPDVELIYRVMGRKTVELARRKGSIDRDMARELLKILA